MSLPMETREQNTPNALYLPHHTPPPCCNRSTTMEFNSTLEQKVPCSTSYVTPPPSYPIEAAALQGVVPSPVMFQADTPPINIQIVPQYPLQKSVMTSPTSPTDYSLGLSETPAQPGISDVHNSAIDGKYKNYYPLPSEPTGTFYPFLSSPTATSPIPSISGTNGLSNTGPLWSTIPSLSGANGISNTGPLWSTMNAYSPVYSGSLPMQSASDIYSTGNPHVGMSGWGSYQPIPSMNIQHTPQLSMDTPRFKITPERARPLKIWLQKHKEYPFPKKYEKLALCQLTQLTLTQVSTWFANARRRERTPKMKKKK